MIELKNTGERILLEKETPMMIARHLCAYRFAKDYVPGKTVLDIGCGEGYGTYYLSETAKSIIGIDYDQAVVDYAERKYKRENLQFRALDAERIGSLGQRPDVICSFQFIEHIRTPEKLLEDINNLLTGRGTFICSTPNKLDASPHSPVPLNRFHIHEYLYDEFRELLGRIFSSIEIFGLKRGKRLNFYRRLKKIGLLNFLPDAQNPVKRFYQQIGCSDFIIAKEEIDAALDFIAVCKK